MIFGNTKRSKIPLGPPLAKGEDELLAREVSNLMPPFRKGGLGLPAMRARRGGRGDFVHGLDSSFKIGQTLAQMVGTCQVKAVSGNRFH